MVDLFGIDEVNIDSGLYEAGGDSITTISIYDQITFLFEMTGNITLSLS